MTKVRLRVLLADDEETFRRILIRELTDMRDRKALLLSGGQQKLVALGRALAIGTRCLLLDEPFEGIAPALSERLSEVLASLKGKDLTLLRFDRRGIHDRTRRQSDPGIGACVSEPQRYESGSRAGSAGREPAPDRSRRIRPERLQRSSLRSRDG